VYNPAFDVTPAELITGIVTDRGVVHAPYRDNIRKLFD
jgi:methylthioribose-1-phosphate isomerase